MRRPCRRGVPVSDGVVDHDDSRSRANANANACDHHTDGHIFSGGASLSAISAWAASNRYTADRRRPGPRPNRNRARHHGEPNDHVVGHLHDDDRFRQRPGRSGEQREAKRWRGFVRSIARRRRVPLRPLSGRPRVVASQERALSSSSSSGTRQAGLVAVVLRRALSRQVPQPVMRVNAIETVGTPNCPNTASHCHSIGTVPSYV